MENNNKPVRRVGTFTMGLYLIVIGVLAIYATFQPNFDFMLLLKLTPIVFIFLGVEILIYHFALKTEKIKYDIFSIFICLVLIGVTICTACVPSLISVFGPEREIKASQLEEELYNACYDKLKDNKDILEIDTNAYLSYHISDYSRFDINNADTYTTITLIPSINTTENFAKACKNILESLSDVNYGKITFKVTDNDKHMVLNIHDSNFAKNLDLITLEAMVELTDE